MEDANLITEAKEYAKVILEKVTQLDALSEESQANEKRSFEKYLALLGRSNNRLRSTYIKSKSYFHEEACNYIELAETLRILAGRLKTAIVQGKPDNLRKVLEIAKRSIGALNIPLRSDNSREVVQTPEKERSRSALSIPLPYKDSVDSLREVVQSAERSTMAYIPLTSGNSRGVVQMAENSRSTLSIPLPYKDSIDNSREVFQTAERSTMAYLPLRLGNLKEVHTPKRSRSALHVPLTLGDSRENSRFQMPKRSRSTLSIPLPYKDSVDNLREEVQTAGRSTMAYIPLD